MTNENKKCADTIKEDLKSRIEQLEQFQECHDDDERREELEQEWRESILSIDSEKVHKVLLSWGGPSDFFEIRTKAGEITQIDYVTQDWFDSARVNIPGGEAFDRIASEFSYLADMDV